MKHKVLLLPDALLDIKEILDWYNFVRKGLGKKFYDSLKLKIKSISINPLSFQLSYKESRSTILDNFPYQIHFWLDVASNVSKPQRFPYNSTFYYLCTVL